MNKFRAVRTNVDGIWFDSKAEARRYRELRLLQKAGAIKDLTLQPPFKLWCGDKPVKFVSGRQAIYRADFSYTDTETGEAIVEDVKGKDTQLSKLKRACVEAHYGVRVVLVK